MGKNDPDQDTSGDVRSFSTNQHGGGNGHDNNVDEKEQDNDKVRNVSISVQVKHLVGPLGDNSDGIFVESSDHQESTDGRNVWLNWTRVRVDQFFNLVTVQFEFFTQIFGQIAILGG